MFPYPFGFLQSGDATDPAFIMKINTNSTGNFRVPCTSTGYNYDVDWGDGSSDTGQTTSITHTYGVDDDYIVTITGTFPRIYFNNSSEKLKLQEVQNWGTGSWDSMRRAFYGCSNMTITATDTADFSSVNDFEYAFSNCTSLVTVPNSADWVTSTCIDMQYIFNKCTSLTTLDSSGWDTSNVQTMRQAFLQCYVLSALDTSGWDTSSFTGLALYQTFNQCRDLTTLDIGHFDVSACTSFSLLFRDCESLTSLNVTEWDTSSLTQMDGCFRDMADITELDLGGWDVSNVTTMSYTFYNCPNLTTIGIVDTWDISNVTRMDYMFRQCDNLTVDVAAWIPTGVTHHTGLTQTFSYMESTGTGNVTGYETWDVSNITNFQYTFRDTDANAGTFPDTWDMSAGTSFLGTFRNWSTITGSIDCSAMKFGPATQMWYMFGQNNGLTDITFGPDCDFSATTKLNNALDSSSLTDVTWDSGVSFAALKEATNMILGEMSTTSYDLFLARMRATWNTATPITGSLGCGSSQYTKTILVSSSADGTTANKLVDNGEDFITLGVQINDIVHNTTDNSYAKITAIDDLHTLSLNADIMVSGDNYSIDTGTPAKDKEYLESYGWAIIDAN